MQEMGVSKFKYANDYQVILLQQYKVSCAPKGAFTGGGGAKELRAADLGQFPFHCSLHCSRALQQAKEVEKSHSTSPELPTRVSMERAGFKMWL